MHDLLNAARFSQKVLLLDRAKVLALDTPAKVFDQERLESVYGVKVSVEASKAGFLNVIPIEPSSTHHD